MKPQNRSRQKSPLSLEQNLLPADPLAQRFLDYFNHPWDYILKPINGEWKTYSKYPLKPRTFWQRYQSKKMFLGLRFGQYTKYGTTDLDIKSPYHPQNDPIAYNRLLKALPKLGVKRTLTLTSSDSGGLHIYFFLSEKVKSFELATGMKQILTEAGFEIRPGWLEIFPNTKSYSQKQITLYNGLRLPLQDGSYLLDENLNPVSNDLKDFLDAADWCAEGQDMAQLKRVIKRAKKWYKNTPSAWDYSAEGGITWRSDLELRIDQGWTGRSQTNEILKDIANYGWVFGQKQTVEELAQYIEEQAITLPGYKKWCRHQERIQQRSRDWAKSAVKYWSRYPSNPQRTITYEQLYIEATVAETSESNPSTSSTKEKTPGQTTRRTRQQINRERRADSLNRLEKVIVHLEKLKTLPQKISERIELICRTSRELFKKGFSKKTLQKELYLPLWHPKHRAMESVAQPPKSGVQPRKESAPEAITPKIEDTKIPQTNPAQDKESNSRSHNPHVVQKSQAKTEKPKSAPDKEQREKDPTIMKCFEPEAPIGTQLVEKPNQKREDLKNSKIEIESSNLKNDLISNKHSQNDENLKTESPLIQTSQNIQHRTVEQKLKLTAAMVGKICRLTSKVASGLVELKDYDRNQLRLISQNTLVRVLDEYHSSSLSDDNRPVMLYVQPLEEADDWLSGIAVPETQLEPVNSTVTHKLNLYSEFESASRKNYNQSLSDEISPQELRAEQPKQESNSQEDWGSMISEILLILGQSRDFPGSRVVT